FLVVLVGEEAAALDDPAADGAHVGHGAGEPGAVFADARRDKTEARPHLGDAVDATVEVPANVGRVAVSPRLDINAGAELHWGVGHHDADGACADDDAEARNKRAPLVHEKGAERQPQRPEQAHERFIIHSDTVALALSPSGRGRGILSRRERHATDFLTSLST